MIYAYFLNLFYYILYETKNIPFKVVIRAGQLDVPPSLMSLRTKGVLFSYRFLLRAFVRLFGDCLFGLQT